MGCCLVAETKDDFKGYRIIKGNGKKFELKKIDKKNNMKEEEIINKKSNIINSPNEILKNSKMNNIIIKNDKKLLNSNIKEKIKKNESINIIENFRYNNNKLYETREFYTHKDFIKGEIKGKGRFGIVYSGLCSNSGEIVAIKIYDNISKEKIENICNNIKNLYYLNHPNLIRAIPLIDSCNLINFNNKEYFSIIYEISNGDSLKDLIKKFGELSEVLIQKYSFGILQGLQYLHSKNIIHKNIKSSNILVDSNGTIRISDSLIDNIILGEGKEIYNNIISGNNLLDDKENNIDFYIPPFFIKNCKKKNYEINYSYDLWCLGCVIIESFTGKNPWSEKNFHNQNEFINFLNKNPNLTPSIPENLTKECKDFLNILFDYNQTCQNDIYIKLFNLDYFKNNKNNNNGNNKSLNLNNSLEKSSIKGSSITINNIFNVNVLNKRKSSNLGQNLQKLKVVNILNSNENPTFSVTVSGFSNRNSNLYQSNKSSFLCGSYVKGKNYVVDNNNIIMDEVPEANLEQSPFTIKDNKKNIYNFNDVNGKKF